MSAGLLERTIRRVEVGASDECWSWLGFIDKAGYGRIRLGGRDLPVGYAHRVMYELQVGPIPVGLQIDHLCRNRSCVNPAHLEPVTQRENMLRGMAPSAISARTDRCKRDHDFAEHAYVAPRTGARRCRQCRRERRAAGVAA